ncbi:reverse transcriptase [Senna tora]|uniref:Reverse transcriptase n=1 Tax=Senna tora TaxID=362788 RepID=A0A834WGB1_9FABA|nr:reverse transcriptase [Senna tora]
MELTEKPRRTCRAANKRTIEREIVMGFAVLGSSERNAGFVVESGGATNGWQFEEASGDGSIGRRNAMKLWRARKIPMKRRTMREGLRERKSHGREVSGMGKEDGDEVGWLIDRCRGVDCSCLFSFGGKCGVRGFMEMQEDEVQLVWNQEEVREEFKHLLIGKILTQKVLNRNAVMTMIRKGWNVRDGVNIGEVRGVFAVEDPLVEKSICRSFLRVGVEVDVDKPLRKGMWITGSKGKRHWIYFKYERLQNYCYGCGMLGHERRMCGNRRDDNGGKEEEGYGPGLGVPSAKEIKGAVCIVKKEYEEWYQDKVDDKQDKSRKEEGMREEKVKGKGKEKFESGEDIKMKEGNWVDVNNGSWKGERRSYEDVSMSRIMRNIKSAVLKGDCSTSIGKEDSWRSWDGKGVEGRVKGCRDLVLRSPEYFVEMPQEDREGGEDTVMQKVVEEEELAENLRKVAIKRKEEEARCNAELKRMKREVYVIEKEEFAEGKDELIISEKRRRKKKMSKVVLESFQLIEVPISLGNWDGKKMEVEGFEFQASSVKGDVAEGKELKKLCRKFNPSIVFLMETRMNSKKMEKVRKKCSVLSTSFYVDAVGKSGGLALWWSDEVAIRHMSGSKNIINGLVESKLLEDSCYFSFVYGAPMKSEKIGVWNRIRRLKPVDGKVWFCLGDFNDILSNAEKSGGRIRSTGSLLEFQNLVFDCDWVDLGFKGSMFTWSNKQLEHEEIKERLDRCFCNLVARELFQNAQVINLEAIGSDHSPLIVDLNIVDTGWKWDKEGVDGEAIMLRKRLEKCSVVLKEWSRKVFPNNLKEIEKLTYKLSVCRNDMMTMEKRVEDYFGGLFKSVGRRDMSYVLSFVEKGVSEEDNDGLLKDVIDEEIKRATFELGALKAPGPDGYSGKFFHSSWDIVGKQVIETVKGFFNMRGSLERLNETNIVVIPKIDKPEFVTQYRPISLCNFTYKIISKVMVNRLRNLLPKLVSEQQRAFMKGRLIQDNIVIAHEVYHYLKNRANGGRFELAMKIDMAKAYDRVEWDFLEQVLLKLGFCVGWVDRVMACVKSVDYNVLVGGRKVADFKPGRGLRQGDPLSPCLFILVADVLSSMLNKAVFEGRLCGIRLARNLIAGRETLEKGLGWRLGNGEKIKVWGDKWIPALSSFCLSSPVPGVDWENVAVSSIIQNGSWKLDGIKNFLTVKELDAIRSMPIPSLGSEDVRVWVNERNGAYSVKSGYLVAKRALEKDVVSKASSSFVVPKELWVAIWKLKVAEKVKHFIWRLCTNSLPTMVNLVKRRCNVKSCCPVCSLEEESSEHLLLFCKWTEMVWYGSLFCARWDRFEVKRVEIWWCNLLLGENRVDDWIAALFAYTCWHIWKARCCLVFEHADVDASFVIQRSFAAAAEFWNGNGLVKNGGGLVKDAGVIDRWCLPATDHFKINCDASFLVESGSAGLGILVRDSKGNMICGRNMRVNAFSVNVAEALALREALKTGLSLQLCNFSVESDCKCLVEAVNNKDVSWDWSCSELVKEILLLCGQLKWPPVNHIGRNANKAADWIAKIAVRRLCPLSWESFPPPSLGLILVEDCGSDRIGVG